MNAIDDTEHWCPRRAETGNQHSGPDDWGTRASLGGGIGPSCSYCGSLDPETFMRHVRDGWIVEPTDKTYKVYLARPFTPEQVEAAEKQAMSGRVWRAVYETSVAAGKTPDEATNAADGRWAALVGGARRGRTVAKFYSQHLGVVQRGEFIALYDARRVAMGYPGRFYTRPYFCQPRQADGTAAGDA